jgi:hypothetical protein
LFDLPYDPSSTAVTPDQAAAIAAEWGARLPSDDDAVAAYSLIRRMPADWSSLSPAERRAWSIEPMKTDRPAAAGEARLGRWRRRRRVVDPALEQSERALDERIVITRVDRPDVIDLTDAREDARATVDDK